MLIGRIQACQVKKEWVIRDRRYPIRLLGGRMWLRIQPRPLIRSNQVSKHGRGRALRAQRIQHTYPKYIAGEPMNMANWGWAWSEAQRAMLSRFQSSAHTASKYVRCRVERSIQHLWPLTTFYIPSEAMKWANSGSVIGMSKVRIRRFWSKVWLIWRQGFKVCLAGIGIR